VARFVDPALWNKAVQDEGEDNLDQFYLFGGMGINSHTGEKTRIIIYSSFGKLHLISTNYSTII